MGCNLEDEELALAIALSLSEDGNGKSRETIEQEQMDEALARSLQQKLNTTDQSLINKDHTSNSRFLTPQSSTSLSPDDAHCAGCNNPLIPRNRSSTVHFKRALDHYWHPNCFVCTSCKQTFDGPFTVDEHNQPYHKECHRTLFHPRCSVCSDFLPNEGNQIVWKETPFWKDKTCPSHVDDGTPRCTSCNRYKPRQTQWKTLPDARTICNFCNTTAIPDTESCQPLYDNILSFYSKMGMTLPVRPPLMLVDNEALNAASAREDEHRGSARSDGPVFHTRGLCLSEHSETVYTIPMKKGFFGRVYHEEVFRAENECQVTAILVLNGLPYLMTGCIVAHECMHAWFRLRGGYEDLPLEVEEGLCQLMALLWLENGQHPGIHNSNNYSSSNNNSDERFAAYLGHEIRTDRSIVYGDGFRAALEAYQRLGLTALLAHVQKARRFP